MLGFKGPIYWNLHVFFPKKNGFQFIAGIYDDLWIFIDDQMIFIAPLNMLCHNFPHMVCHIMSLYIIIYMCLR